jgi:SAM-dependent methyltransferase
MNDARPLDPERLKEMAKRVFGTLAGAMTSAMIHLGDRLGLYRALLEKGPATSHELAERTGLSERWVREWLHQQGAARLLEHDAAERFSLSPEAAAILAEEDHPAFGVGFFDHLPQTLALLELLPEAFRTGLGLPYDAHGPDCARGVERGLAPWYRTFLVPFVLPRLPGVAEKLAEGGRVADVGCGSGVALLELARRFPRAELHGFEISRHALERAEENRAQAGARHVHFHDAGAQPLPEDGSFDLVLSFDCLHDMTRPDRVIASIRGALRPDGTWLVADMKAYDSFGENLERNPMAALMYGFSVVTCMSSALSEPGGLGLGTLGLSETRLRAMSEQAGFTRFRRLDVDHPINAFYEVRP